MARRSAGSRIGGCEDPAHHYGDSTIYATIKWSDGIDLRVCRHCVTSYQDELNRDPDCGIEIVRH